MNIFKQFFKSIYSPKDIALFRFQGIGKTILYVFFLTLISILPSIFYLSTSLSNGIDTARSVIKDEIPSFSINNGKLEAETKVPKSIEKNNFTILLDPTGALSEKDVEAQDNAFALLKNEFVLAAGGKTQTYPYSMLQGMKITKSNLLDFINSIDSVKAIIIPIASFLIYIFSSASSFIEVTVLALIGLAINNLTGRKLKYGQLWRIAAYSETLPTVFFTIMSAIKTYVPNSFIINWFVIIIVLYLAVNETPKPKKID